MKKKLTAVTIKYNGIKDTFFVMAAVIDGKTYISFKKFEQLFKDRYGFGINAYCTFSLN